MMVALEESVPNLWFLSDPWKERWFKARDATTDPSLLREAIQEAYKKDTSPAPEFVESIIKRCIRENCRPGQWPSSKKGRASPPKPEPVPYGKAEDRFWHPVLHQWMDQTKETLDGQHTSG